MGSAFERPEPEMVLTGRELRFFANAAPKIERLPDGNFMVYLAVQRDDVAEVEAYMVCSPGALARIGRQFLTLSDGALDIRIMRIVAGPNPH